MCGASTQASAIGRRAGTDRAGSWRRWSGIPASCTRVSASSSPTSIDGPRRWSPSTTGADGRAVDQGRQERGQVDAAVVHHLPGERCPAPAPRTGLQPRQLPPYAAATDGDRRLVPDKPAGEGREDRGEGGRPWPLPGQMAEVAVPRELFRGILQRIAGLRPAVVARC
jgi:hypothetical protein